MPPHTHDPHATSTPTDAVNQLFAQHYKHSLRIASRILRTKEDCEDAVQTAYGNAFRKLHTYRGESSFGTWITQIVLNCCRERLRERDARQQLGVDGAERTLRLHESQKITPEELCYRRELEAAHQHAASCLPRILHDVYVPCEIEGSPFEEVARRLGLTPGAAKTRLFRACRKVEQTLRPVIGRFAA